MTVPYETRRENLAQLIKYLDMGNISAFARRVGKNPNYLQRLLWPPGKPGCKRLGEDFAYDLTYALGMEYGRLDTPIFKASPAAINQNR